MLPVLRSQALLGLCLVVPGLALITLFVLVPAIQTIWYSFHRWDGFSPDMTFVGLRMYEQAIEGLGFSEALQHSLIWGAVALVVPPGIALVAAAIVEDSRIRWKSLFRFAFFLPYFFSMAVAGAIFTRVYDPSYGMLNQLLQVVGIDVAPQWLGDRSLAIWAAIGVFVWHETAFCFIVFAAAIQQLDRELYAAATARWGKCVPGISGCNDPRPPLDHHVSHDRHAHRRANPICGHLRADHAGPRWAVLRD